MKHLPSSFCAFFLLCFIISACSSKKYSSDQAVFTSDNSYRISGNGTSLTREEVEVFNLTGQLDRNLNQEQTQSVLEHYQTYLHQKRSTMQKFLNNSSPYIASVKKIFHLKNLPDDLVYLAFLESGYNPRAISRSKASGLWQFMAATGTHYGLKQDAWVDERFSPYMATAAATTYLEKLHSIFNDWHLAVASYNAGEGKIGRAKQAAGANSLQELIKKNNELEYQHQLREETRLYVPRFLAIAKIMRNYRKLGLTMDNPELSPDYLHPILLPPRTDLVELCKAINMPWEEFLVHNTHFFWSVSPAGYSEQCIIPADKVSIAKNFLSQRIICTGYSYYIVKPNDTLVRISRLTRVPVIIIRQLNSGNFKTGSRILLPSKSNFAAAAKYNQSLSSKSVVISKKSDSASSVLQELKAKTRQQPIVKESSSSGFIIYMVKFGDTPYNVSKKFNISINELKYANRNNPDFNSFIIGCQIIIPNAASFNPQAYNHLPEFHIVVRGDTPTSIARRYGLSYEELVLINGGKNAFLNLSPGRQIRLRPSTKRKSSSPVVYSAPSSNNPQNTGEVVQYVVKKGDTLWNISQRFNVTPESILSANGMTKNDTLLIGQTLRIKK